MGATMTTARETAERMTKELADSGKLIEGGWMGYRLMIVPEGASETQIDECRTAFFAGAQHLFGSIMNMMDPGEEPSEADERKLELIHKELLAFANTMMLRTSGTSGSA
jgi:hypothetical protein